MHSWFSSSACCSSAYPKLYQVSHKEQPHSNHDAVFHLRPRQNSFHHFPLFLKKLFIWLHGVLVEAGSFFLQILLLQLRLSCPGACGILVSWPGIRQIPTALTGRVLTTGPPGKSCDFPLDMHLAVFRSHLCHYMQSPKEHLHMSPHTHAEVFLLHGYQAVEVLDAQKMLTGLQNGPL